MPISVVSGPTEIASPPPMRAASSAMSVAPRLGVPCFSISPVRSASQVSAPSFRLPARTTMVMVVLGTVPKGIKVAFSPLSRASRSTSGSAKSLGSPPAGGASRADAGATSRAAATTATTAAGPARILVRVFMASLPGITTAPTA